jgi:8-hydroxy-5-deazaflavin:NADPH oxidoreductase
VHELNLPDEILADLSQGRCLYAQRLGGHAAGAERGGRDHQHRSQGRHQTSNNLHHASPPNRSPYTLPESPVCIVGGTGALGFGLAVRLGRAGVPIVIGSRDAGRAQEAAERHAEQVPGASCAAAENADAVKDSEIVILSVPFRSQSETLTNLKGVLRPGQLLVDATVPLAAAVSGKATRTLGVWQGSAAQQAQEMAPEGVNVVSAFHTVSAALLSDLDHKLDEDVLICGDRRDDKAKVAELVTQIDGLRPVDCGPLEMARIVETLTPLLISINVRNKVRAGIKITGLNSH